MTCNSSLSSDRDTFLRRRRTDVVNPLASFLIINFIHTRLPVQEAALLDRAAALQSSRATRVDIAVAAAALACTAYARRRQVRDVFGEGMLGTDAAGVDGASFAGLGQRVVARVEVLALFEVLGQVVGLGGELAIEAEESLLVWGERL